MWMKWWTQFKHIVTLNGSVGGWVVKSVLSLLLILWLVSSTGVQETWDQMPRATLWMIPVLGIGYIASQWVSTFRWRWLCQAFGYNAPFFALFRSYLWGTFYNLFLPSSVGGDAYRTLRLAPMLKQSVPPSFFNEASGFKRVAALLVLMDRLMGLGALLLLMAVLFTVDQNAQQLLKGWVGVCQALALIFLTAMVTFVMAYDSWIRPRLLQFAPHLGLCLDRVKLAKGLLLSFVVQGLMWVLHLLIYQGFLAFFTSAPTLFVVYGLATLASLAPFAFNGLGVREGAYQLLLKQAGWDASAALSFALIWFMVTLVAGLFAGIVGMLLDRIPDEALKQNTSHS